MTNFALRTLLAKLKIELNRWSNSTVKKCQWRVQVTSRQLTGWSYTCCATKTTEDYNVDVR